MALSQGCSPFKFIHYQFRYSVFVAPLVTMSLTMPTMWSVLFAFKRGMVLALKGKKMERALYVGNVVPQLVSNLSSSHSMRNFFRIDT